MTFPLELMTADQKLDFIIGMLRQHEERFAHMEQAIHVMRTELKQEIKDVRKALKGDIRDIKDDIKEIKQSIHLIEEKLQEVYDARDRVAVKFTYSWAIASFFLAIVAATVVLAVDNAFF